MYSIVVNYPVARHICTGLQFSTTLTISSYAIKLDRKPLVKMINTIFDGNYQEIFDDNGLVMGDCESILLTTKDLMEVI